ncbi:MDR family MFS transporter [Kocuria palustris]|nr:MDR family MFS transporter [Kocuria palustris]
MIDPPPKIIGLFLREVMLLLLTVMAQFLCQGGITMSLTPMNLIMELFHSVEETAKVWFMGSFALTVGTFILISGRLGDIYGLKLILLIGWAWVFVWSLITGCSVYVDSVIFFIICRAFQGIGFALVMPCALGILGTVYDGHSRKNLAFGLMGAGGPTGATIGALMAAVVSQLAWWPWSYWLLAIVAFGICILLYFFVPNVNELQRREGHTKPRFDWIGLTLGVSGLILFNFVWNQGPVVGWGTAYIIVLLPISVAFIIAFFIAELKFVKSPLLPKTIFNRRIGLVLLCMGLGWGSFGVWQFYYWNYILNLRQYTPINAGLLYLPFFVLGTIALLTVSYIIKLTKPLYLIMFSMLAFMLGGIMLVCTPVHQSFWQMTFGMQFILCWAMDLSFPAAAIILLNYLPLHHQGMAGSLLLTVVNYLVSLFLAMSLTVEIQTMKHTHDVLKSYKGALYFSIGVAALGVVFAAVFIFVQRHDDVGADFTPQVSNTSDEKESVSQETTQMVAKV